MKKERSFSVEQPGAKALQERGIGVVPADASKMAINCADAFTLLTGRLAVPVERLYTLYNELTRDNLYTHQLPRAFRICRPSVAKQLPELARYCAHIEPTVTTKNWMQCVEDVRSKFGDSFEIEHVEDWCHKDPILEAIEMKGGAL